MAIKEKNRKARQAKKELEKEVEEVVSSIDDGDQIAHLTLMIEKLKKQKEGLQYVIESTKRDKAGKGHGCTIEKGDINGGI